MKGAVVFRIALLILITGHVSPSKACDGMFEGFGIYLGSANHFSQSPAGTVKKVLELVYSDLGIRHYRTSYESAFSPSPNVYKIACNDNFTCAWIEIHKEISKYSSISLIASIWSPPHYMKNKFDNLLITSEHDYLNFIRNVTQLIKTEYSLTVERVSPINEPENVLASWEHTNMPPNQLCRMVKDFNDSLVSLCPENSYYWISEMYQNYTDLNGVDCPSTCEIFGTHAYDFNIDFESANNFKAYYDLNIRERNTTKPIWMTEVSSTYGSADSTQIQEALDFATNIVNFVGHTCIQRYYYWSSYTLGYSGESLIWGKDNGELTLPKKYYTYKHFTQASSGGSKKVSKCNPSNIEGISCIKFGQTNATAVFINTLNSTTDIFWDASLKCENGSLCCTSDESDWKCDVNNGKTLTARSVCSCKVSENQNPSLVSAASPVGTAALKTVSIFFLVLLLTPTPNKLL